MQALGSIRVLLAFDGLAADLLERQLRHEPDFELVGRATPKRALGAARRAKPDFVVLPLTLAGEPCGAGDLFEAVEKVKVLTIETTSGRAILSELIGDIAPRELADALRRAAARETL